MTLAIDDIGDGSAIGIAVALFWSARYLSVRFRRIVRVWGALYSLRILITLVERHILDPPYSSPFLHVLYHVSLVVNFVVILYFLRGITDLERSDRLGAEIREKRSQLALLTLRELVDTVTVIPWQDRKEDVEKSVTHAARIIQRLRSLHEHDDRE